MHIYSLVVVTSEPESKGEKKAPQLKERSALLTRMCTLIMNEKADRTVRKYALIALSNLSFQQSSHQLLLATCAHVFIHLFDLVSEFDSDLNVKRGLAMLFMNLASNPRTHMFMANKINIAQAVTFLSCDDRDTQVYAIAALSGLSTSETNAMRIVSSHSFVGLLVVCTLKSGMEVRMLVCKMHTHTHTSVCYVLHSKHIKFILA